MKLLTFLPLFVIISISLFLGCGSDKSKNDSSAFSPTAPQANPNFIISNITAEKKDLGMNVSGFDISFKYTGALGGIKTFFHSYDGSPYFPSNTWNHGDLTDSGNNSSNDGIITYKIISQPGSHSFSAYLEDNAGNFSNSLSISLVK